MVRIRQAFTNFFDLVPEEELVEAQDYLRGLTVRWTRAMAILMVVSVVGLWPSDALIFHNHPDYQSALFTWRFFLSTASFVMALGLTFLPVIRDHPTRAFIAAAAIVMGASGYAVGQLGGIDNPLFYAVYPIPATTVALLTPLRERIAANLTIVVSYLAGFFAAIFPQPLPLALAGPIIFLASSSSGMTFLGHIVYRLVGSNYSRRRQLEHMVESQKRDLALATREALTAHENVRARVLRDLHDNVGPVITALHLDTYATRQSLEHTGEDRGRIIGEFIRTVEDHSRVLKDLIRATLTDLDPYGIQRANLTDLITSTLADLGMPNSHTIHISLDPAINALPAEIRQAVNLLVRECAHNVVKHANAKGIFIEAAIDRDNLRLNFADDGDGCDLKAVELNKSQYGLAGIRLRALAGGGAAQIVSSPGNGFRVEIRLPINSSAAPV